MTAPTQQLPPWLSISSSIATDANGDPTATATTLLRLPLTYYGPSIPLGTDGSWVYGGLTSPPPETTSASSTNPTSSVTPTSVSSITSSPLSSTFLSSSSLTLFTSSPSSTSSSASLSSSSSSSSPSSSASPIAASSHSHKRTIIGAVLGSVLGSLLLLFLLIICLRLRSRSRSRQGGLPQAGSSLWMWEMVDPSQPPAREPGEGSPRGSGDEHDSFLRRSGGATDGMKEVDPSARLVRTPSRQVEGSSAVGVALANIPPGETQPGSTSTRGSGEKSQVSGATPYSSFLDLTNPTSNGGRPGSRHIIPRDVLIRMYPDSPTSPRDPAAHEDEEPEHGQDSPLLPPRLIDPDTLGSNANRLSPSRKPSLRSLPSTGSMTPDAEAERATVHTARRVRVGDLGVPAHTLASVPDNSPRDEVGPSWARGIGIGSLAKFGRLSWFNREAPPSSYSRPGSRGPSRPTSFAARALSDAEMEAGRAAASAIRLDMSFRDGSRPISTVSKGSAKSSGHSVYFDAASRPQTPLISPPPTAVTSAKPGPSHLSTSHGPEGEPPAYEPSVPPAQPGGSGEMPSEITDILDMPIPAPIPPFAAAQSSIGRSGDGKTSFPPGLAPLPNPSAWRDSGSGESPASFGSGSLGSAPGISIDILEEAPPAAREGWRQMRGGSGHVQERRTTFGTPPVLVHPREHNASEEASLHSMRSHLSPLSASGSAPSSRHTLSTGSGHSQGQSGSSGASLTHSGSISSDGRRRHRADPGEISPPISAIGRSSMMPMRRDASSPSPQRVPVFPVLPPVISATVTSSSTTTTGQTSSSVTTHTSIVDPSTGEVMRFPHVPWTGGLSVQDGSGSSRSAWGGSWSSPSHLQALRTHEQDHGYHT